jgi:hypothetical protein
MIDLETARSARPTFGSTLLGRVLPGLLLALGLGCLGKATNSVEGSQTHFLSCEIDADCQAVDPRLSCQGGQCSDPSTGFVPARASAVGEPCIMADEASPYYAGANLAEISIEEGPGQSCGPGLFCVANRFQGRVTCPAGQAAGSGDCLTTTGEVLMVPVPPQLESRPAEQRVVCSCRCAGPGPSRDFCSCPTGMRCETILGGAPENPYAGSYCAYPDDDPPL